MKTDGSLDTMDKTGPVFSSDLYFQARQKCIDATDEIIRRVVPGMNEKDGILLVDKVFRQCGVTKFWHPTKFRAGTDTCKSFRELGDPSLVTVAGDVCFVDLGPVFDGHEADFGRTFVVRDDGAIGEPAPGKLSSSEVSIGEVLAIASEEVFRETAEYWLRTRTAGTELLRFASEAARARGYVLNPKMAGHRLGDFPHQVYARKESLFDLQRVPSPDLWVLEIHLLDQKISRGAFYEDILRGDR